MAAWVAPVVTAGLILTIDQPNLWLMVACLAMIPAAIGSWLWNQPEATLSEVIVRTRSRF